ncbi:MAG: hypothetical protein D6803_02380 [Anaerolineae bacterium]|nr:MAG: hypothetical protein D6803_02380 [Anaerolineae bacterium]
MTHNQTNTEFAKLYAALEAPVTALDCGKKCAPYNEYGVPFCCDIRHTVPALYRQEWEYLRLRTDLWRLWEAPPTAEGRELAAGTPPGMVLAACRGHQHCQRAYRSLACRAFPFFPYFDSRGEWLGMSYYWDYEDRCWVISHLEAVTPQFAEQFFAAFEQLFDAYPQEREIYAYHSQQMRAAFAQRRRAIPLRHRNGQWYKISPRNERKRKVAPASLPAHGVYHLAKTLPFPDEITT